MTSTTSTSSGSSRSPKIFVLDTSVILYDANAIFNFKEHDVAIPITVLEELDHFKKGDTVINLQAREFIRQLDKLTSHDMLNNWVPLDGPDLGRIRVIATEDASTDARVIFGAVKNDHRILNTALALKESEPGRDVILVSKDINLRVKARALRPARRGVRDRPHQGRRPSLQGQERDRGRRRGADPEVLRVRRRLAAGCRHRGAAAESLLHPAQSLALGARLVQPGSRACSSGSRSCRPTASRRGTPSRPSRCTRS